MINECYPADSFEFLVFVIRSYTNEYNVIVTVFTHNVYESEITGCF